MHGKDGEKMTEEDSNIFGKIEMKPEQGLQIKIMEPSELTRGSNVVVLKKESGSSFLAVKGIYTVDFDAKGNMVLTEEKEELGDPKVRAALAHALVEMNKEALMQQALIVTEKALSRKSVPQLKNFFKNKVGGHKLELKTRVGCVYLKIGDEETVL